MSYEQKTVYQIKLLEGQSWKDKPYQIVYPPSITSTLPVTKLEALEAKNKAGPFISEGLPNLPRGVNEHHPLPYLGKTLSTRGVLIYPGAIALTLILYFAHSAAKDLVSIITPALELL